MVGSESWIFCHSRAAAAVHIARRYRADTEFMSKKDFLQGVVTTSKKYIANASRDVLAGPVERLDTIIKAQQFELHASSSSRCDMPRAEDWMTQHEQTPPS